MNTNTSSLFVWYMLMFVDLFAYKTLIVLFKVKNNLLPIGIQSYLQSTTVSAAGVKLWNSLNANITTVNKMCVFKKMCTSNCLYKSTNNTRLNHTLR